MLVSVVAMGGLLGAVASQETPAAKVETWKIDPVHSSTLFRIQHAGAGRFWGRFNDVYKHGR